MTRFPTYPTDILTRADALLSSKYPDGIVDPALVELLCKMAVEERERYADAVEVLTLADKRIIWDEHGFDRAFNERVEEAIAKAIRGTE